MCLTGCDRHLMGLQLIAMEEGIERPALFTDPSWVKRWVVSCSSTILTGFCWREGGIVDLWPCFFELYMKFYHYYYLMELSRETAGFVWIKWNDCPTLTVLYDVYYVQWWRWQLHHVHEFRGLYTSPWSCACHVCQWLWLLLQHHWFPVSSVIDINK